MALLHDEDKELLNEDSRCSCVCKGDKRWLVIGGLAAMILALYLLAISLLREEGGEKGAVSLLKAPETPSKIYPKEEEASDPLKEVSVYRRLSPGEDKSAPSVDAATPLPAPEEVVPSARREEDMRLTPQEKAQLRGVVSSEDSEDLEEEDVVLEAPPKLSPEGQSLGSSPSQSSGGKEVSAQVSASMVSAEKKEDVGLSGKSPIRRKDSPPLVAQERRGRGEQHALHRIRGFKVQIASFETREHALQEWQRLRRRPMFKRRDGEIARVDLGSARGIRYRVYVGPFGSNQEAVRFAEKLKAQRIDALVVHP